MKSTLKIDYVPNGSPIIKILRPKEVVDLHKLTEGDYDVRDKLLSDFVHSPMNPDINRLFQVYTHGTLEKAPDYSVTTIAPVDVLKQFGLFMDIILTRMIPYEDLVKIHRNEIPVHSDIGTRKTERFDLSHEKFIKINEFFNWLNETEWTTWEDQQPNIELTNKNSAIFKSNTKANSRTRRDYFEIDLSSEWRITAFENTPKDRLDEYCNSLYEAMKYVKEWRDEKEY